MGGGGHRFYVHKKVYDEFINKYCKEVSKLVLGPGEEPGVTQGPLINRAAIEKVRNASKSNNYTRLSMIFREEGKAFKKMENRHNKKKKKKNGDHLYIFL